MKRIFFLLTIFFTGTLLLTGQPSMKFYRTASSYESFKWDKVPFAMATITLTDVSDDSVKISDRIFYNNGSNIYVTRDGKGFFVIVEKGAFIVTPDGKDWTCYYRDQERIREITVFPDYSGADELKILKEAMLANQKPDERLRNYYITYMSYKSKANTNYAENILPVIFISADSIRVDGHIFKKWDNDIYRDATGDYLYAKDKESLVFRDKDFTDWSSFYVPDNNAAADLIIHNYTPQKELNDLNVLIESTRAAVHKKIIDYYYSRLQPARNDPALTTAVTNYWKGRWPSNPVIRVIPVDNDYSIIRNAYGVVLRKSITAWVVYKENGKCYMQWHSYGYEALGNGAFANNLSQWKMNTADHAIEASSSAGSLNLFSGDKYEVNCVK